MANKWKPLVILFVTAWLFGNTASFFAGNALCKSRIVLQASSSRTLTEDSTSSYVYANYTLEYSPNFRRHIVRKDGKVLESFVWWEEARERYPVATLLPAFETHKLDPNVAGVGWNQTECYPIYQIHDMKSNYEAVRGFLQEHLKWFPAQIDRLEESWPRIRTYPVSLLKERIQFLLADIPREQHILDQVNSSWIDWPKLYYQSGYGPGMSVAQLSHALQVLPSRILRLGCDYESPFQPALLAFLYDQTPSVVLEMTRAQLDGWLTGTPNMELAVFAYLHWRGWEWTQCRILLQALPDTASCALEPSWELYERCGEAVRKELIKDALWYMQCRLQLRPWHIHAMFKTHTRLTGYSTEQIKQKLDFLQEHMGMSSAEVQKLVLQMPSILGMSIEGLQTRVHFWIVEVGLTFAELKQIAARKPAILQYSVENNLLPKLSFFRDDLRLNRENIARLTKARPELWGRSMRHCLQPTAQGLKTFCDMEMEELGAVVARAPEILLCNWNSNLLPKLEYFEAKLGLSKCALKNIVFRTPRILMHSLKTSLVPKFEMLQQASSSGIEMFQRNPSLLLNTKSVLEARLNRVTALPSLHDSGKNLVRQRRPVCLLGEDGKSVKATFENVSSAAVYAGTSISNMYSVLRAGRLLNGSKYVYGMVRTGPSPSKHQDTVQLDADNVKEGISENDNHSSYPRKLKMYVSGRAFPPESDVRGRHRTGGLAICVDSWSLKEWKEASEKLWKGQRLRLLRDGKTLILGYPYTLASGPRCSLYVCREALRLASHWVETINATELEVDIMTDSNYALSLVQNLTDLREWGSASSKTEFIFTGIGSEYKANPDILYPLARTFFHLVTQDLISPRERPNVTVRFARTDQKSPYLRKVSEAAHLAATLMYETVR